MRKRLFNASLTIENSTPDQKKTELETLSLKPVDSVPLVVQNPDELAERDLAQHLGDLEIEVSERIKLLNLYNQKFGQNIVEITNKLNTMYLFSKTKLLEEYLYHIVKDSAIDPFIKLETAKTLATYSSRGFDCIEHVITTYDNVPTPVRLDSIYLLIANKDTAIRATQYFCDFLVDQSIECLYRYKAILNLETRLKEDYIATARVACKTFLSCTENMTYYRTLACQYIFNRCGKDPELYSLGLESLFKFAQDPDLDYNLRADAVDVLLNVDDTVVVARASAILDDLGSNGRTVRSIFENAQNVHHKSIEESATKLIRALADVQNPLGMDYDRVRQAIIDICPCDKLAKVTTALNRILIDRAVYGDSHISLMSILIKLWLYIKASDFADELVNRLIEELVDSSDVCGTGYAHRLVNVLSGYTDLGLSIGFDEQISANLNGRLNAVIRSVPDEDFQSLIISEMLVPVINYDKRANFLRFFRENISKIREDMYQEFREHVSDTDYDLYFRKAIMNYEGVNY